ncbi:MAG: hypothetical protein V3V78_04995 [Candidatus Woesearchaeota archaeon]
MVLGKLLKKAWIVFCGDVPESLKLYPCEGSRTVYPESHIYLVDEVLMSGKHKVNVDVMKDPEKEARLSYEIQDEYRQCPECRLLDQGDHPEQERKDIDQILSSYYPNLDRSVRPKILTSTNKQEKV